MTTEATSPFANDPPHFTFSNDLSDTSRNGFFHLNQPYRSFQFLKTNPIILGVAVLPPSYILIHPTGGTASSSSPSYHSSKYHFTKQKLQLPPSFNLVTGGAVPKGSSNENGEGTTLAKIKYIGLEGIISLKIEITTTELVYDQRNNRESQHEGKILIKRKGMGRDYGLKFQDLATSTPYDEGLEWRGTKSAVTALLNEQKEELAQTGRVSKIESSQWQNGNLKLVSPSHPEWGVLAVWHNKTDAEIMGNLYLFEEFDEDEGGLLNPVVASCLAIVAAERISVRGWLGGLGKGKGKAKMEDEIHVHCGSRELYDERNGFHSRLGQIFHF